MRYSILGFSQEIACNISKTIVDGKGKYKTLTLDIVDLLIIQELSDFMNRKKVIKYTIEDKMYFSIKYDSILDDLPILGIKKQALRDRIDKLCELGIVEKKVVKNESGSWTAFRLGDIYESIKYHSTEEGVCIGLHTGVYQTTYGCVADYTPNNYTTITNIQKENTNVFPKKNDYQAVFDCWNKYNGKKIGKITQFTDARKKAIKKMLDIHNISQEVLMRFFASLPFADQWLFHPTGTHKSWKPTFDWWMANTNGWLTKGLEGGVHLENPQAFERIMNSYSFSSTSALYLPQGRTIWFNDETQSYWSNDNFYYGTIDDGYDDDNRPDGAEITLNNARGTYKWNTNFKKWIKK